MRAKDRLTLKITKFKGGTNLPMFIEMGHRHFEKAGSSGIRNSDHVMFQIPLDIVRMGLLPRLVDDITEVTAHYRLGVK